MAGRVDFSEFTGWLENMDRISDPKATEAFMLSCVDRLGSQVLRRAIDRTQVGKDRRVRGVPIEGGTLKGNWQQKPARHTGTVYKSVIFNNTPYAIFVEKGHRIVRGGRTIGWVPGQFMLESSLKEVEATIPTYLDRRLQRFIEEGWM
ncbi:HK97 gp10 family phage protein [Peptococcus simiae]|uniref:HK97 gp10 family phage protein n=1 Tax=Peptococcus simiae TaxID=1643805 RepID=A0ABW9GXK0_9FIRM